MLHWTLTRFNYLEFSPALQGVHKGTKGLNHRIIGKTVLLSLIVEREENH